MSRRNEYGQPIGPALPDWTERPLPPRTSMQGRFCRLDMLDADAHAADLHAAFSLDADGRHWTYLPYGPFASEAAYVAWVRQRTALSDPLMHAVVDLVTGMAVGTAALQQINPANGVIEIGQIRFSPLLQRRPAATEAVYLLLARAFDELGYRRVEWKCDSHNQASRSAAERLGFSYDGTFRQAVVVRGRSRDNVWLSIIDKDWLAIRRGFAAWLAPENFDHTGRQRCRLGDLIRSERVSV